MALDLNEGNHALDAMTPLLRIDIQRKSFGVGQARQQVLGRIGLSLEAGLFASVIGPSGCGKTTLLRCIAGIDEAYDGEILLKGRRLAGPSVDRGVVFQEPRLLPWLSVRENIAFAEQGRRASAERISELMTLVGLRGTEGQRPKELSGGMAQRVSLARALYNLPALLLLDEPFSALDNFHRGRLQGELHQIVQNAGVTSLLVTHDLDEALILSDRIYVMATRPGTISRVLDIALPHPRDRNDPAFARLRLELETILAEAGAATLVA